MQPSSIQSTSGSRNDGRQTPRLPIEGPGGRSVRRSTFISDFDDGVTAAECRRSDVCPAAAAAAAGKIHLLLLLESVCWLELERRKQR